MTRAHEKTPVSDVIIESDACGRTGGGPIEPSIVCASFMVMGVGTLLLVMLGGVVTVELIWMLLPNAVRHIVVEGGSEVFLTLGASLLASERWEVGCMLGGEKVLASCRI